MPFATSGALINVANSVAVKRFEARTFHGLQVTTLFTPILLFFKKIIISTTICKKKANIGANEPAVIQPGRRGIAIAYEDEPKPN